MFFIKESVWFRLSVNVNIACDAAHEGVFMQASSDLTRQIRQYAVKCVGCGLIRII